MHSKHSSRLPSIRCASLFPLDGRSFQTIRFASQSFKSFVQVECKHHFQDILSVDKKAVCFLFDYFIALLSSLKPPEFIHERHLDPLQLVGHVLAPSISVPSRLECISDDWLSTSCDKSAASRVIHRRGENFIDVRRWADGSGGVLAAFLPFHRQRRMARNARTFGRRGENVKEEALNADTHAKLLFQWRRTWAKQNSTSGREREGDGDREERKKVTIFFLFLAHPLRRLLSSRRGERENTLFLCLARLEALNESP